MKRLAKLFTVLCLSVTMLFGNSAQANTSEAPLITEKIYTQSNKAETTARHGEKAVIRTTWNARPQVINRNGAGVKATNIAGDLLHQNQSKFYLPNNIICAITPKAASYEIMFYNDGWDAIDLIDFKLTVKKDNGTVYATYSSTLRNVKVGATTVTWNLAKGSVQETITLSGTASDGGQTIILNSGSTQRYNFVGGKYGAISALDGERHHMPSNAVSPLTAYYGPCIRMTRSDHAKTASYGHSTISSAFQAAERALIDKGYFLGAQKLGIQNVQSLFGTKYDYAIDEMVTYTRVTLRYTK